jgi:hypothetical protein
VVGTVLSLKFLVFVGLGRNNSLVDSSLMSHQIVVVS